MKVNIRMRKENLAMDPTIFKTTTNQRMFDGMSFENGLRNLKVKLDFVTLKVQLDTILHILEWKRNVNTFNYNHVICDLCRGYHATHTCMQVQNVDYYDEFGHCNPCFDQCNHNWGNSYAYAWDNQCKYSDSSCFYEY